MAPGDDYAKLLKWSSCSRQAFRSYFRSWEATCMYNRTNEMPKEVRSMPGSWMSMDGQCDNVFKDSLRYCWDNATNLCTRYGCERFGGNGVCTWINQSPMEGSQRAGGFVRIEMPM